MERVPCVVVGAGAVGLAVGKALSQAGLYTLVLERNPIFGAENSSRNSEVLHAGLYYNPGSHKARMCEKGRFQLLNYMKQRNVPFSQCGKLVVATSMQEVPVLQKIKSNGEMNGLTDLRMLSEKEVHVLEPALACKAAMLSPFTGVFDSHTLMLNYVADIEQEGSSVVYNCAVDSVSLCPGPSSSSSTQPW
jgi:L-2-hydroxyglutarate oxidase LhgO